MKKTASEVVEYMEKFIGAPYRWGGSGPQFDCSGFIQEGLSYGGIDIPGDQNAQMYLNHFKKEGLGNIKGPGALVFYGDGENAISHIEMMIDENTVIGAMGGGRGTTSVDSAIIHGAFVKKRLFGHRQDIIAVIMPKYG